ncbi:hypothetical protein [Mycobacterium decipiens]|uniref:Membrane protein ArfC n=1 Tax=Mycobacterium decipiens TaxID=1430326 RepID=A0A1X2LRV1_9MYCO|nr:hypothetical protein [Mycobacterium decipiens]OSC39451.1 hypothetical protein B8W66_17065 [Mycobacterium decipiens]
MEHVHYWLVGLAFALGMVLTSALMVRPVKHQVPVKKSPQRSGAKSRPPTATKRAVKSRPKTEPLSKEPATARIPVTRESSTDQIAVVKESATEQIPAAKEALGAHIPVVPYAPYGPGSARAGADGSGPEGWLVKGRSDTRLYYTPDDPSYDPTVAQVWFQDEECAARAFFTPWRKSTRRR